MNIFSFFQVRFAALLWTILLTSAFTATQADVLTLNPVMDNTLYAPINDSPLHDEILGSDQRSNGQGSHFFAGLNATPVPRRGVLAFDLSAIPTGSTITSAVLVLNMDMTISGPLPVTLHRLQAAWGEGTSNADGMGGGGGGTLPTPEDATWLHTFFDTDFWANPGGDFDPISSASQVVDGNGAYTWGSTPAMVADVQAWLDNPATNFGWLVQGDEMTSPSTKRFASRENADPALWPQLIVGFDPPIVTIPTLSDTGFLILFVSIAIAGVLLRRRQLVR